MTSRARIWKIAAGIAASLVLIAIGLIAIVQTEWFRNYVREKIVTATGENAGGRVEVGSFSFTWPRLEAVVTDFVIHGSEPAGAAPFVRAQRVRVNIRLLTSIRRFIDVSFIGIDRPEANILLAADGSTNVPTPRKKSASNATGLDSVLDLAVERFEVRNGSLTLNSIRQPLDVTGKNVHALLLYNSLNQSYRGEISLQPVYVVAGRNTPVEFTIRLPIAVERNRIALENARIATMASEVYINGSMVNPKDPGISAEIRGRLALSDVRRLAYLPIGSGDASLPSTAELTANATMTDRRIRVDALHVSAGRSEIKASGNLKGPDNDEPLRFTARLMLDELGRIVNLSTRPEGIVSATGTATLDARNNYALDASVDGRNLSFAQGKGRIGPIELSSALHMDPRRIEAGSMRLAAYGGELAGDASLSEFSRYRLQGRLRNVDRRSLAGSFGLKTPYAGAISGPVEARGDLRAADVAGLAANARLNITPGRIGVPVAGKLYVAFDALTQNLDVDHSFVKLPNTRLNLSGSLNQRLELELTSQDLNDLLVATGKSAPVDLAGGHGTFRGTLTGGFASPQFQGHVAIDHFRVDGRGFDAMSADIGATKTGVSLSNGSISRGEMVARFAISAGLRDWSPKPSERLTAGVNVRNGDLADVAVFAGMAPEGYSGSVNMDASIGGTIGNPTGSANLDIGRGTIAGEDFDRVRTRIDLTDQLVTVPTATITAGEARATLRGEYRHPRDSFTTGRLTASLQGTQIDLERLRTLQARRPNTAGSVNVTADIAGDFHQTKTGGETPIEFELSALSADASARGLRFDGQSYGELNAKAQTSGRTISYEVASDFAGSNFRLSGHTQLAKGYPTTADANLSNLAVERLLALVKRQDIAAKGRLSGSAHVSGTIENPEANVDLDLANAVLYDEPVDHLRVRATYAANSIDIARCEVISGPSRLDLTARYQHPPGNLKAGNLEFRVDHTSVELGRLRNLERIRPGLSGNLTIAAKGAATVREGAPMVLFRTLDADIAVTGLKAQGADLGNATLKANTTGAVVRFALDSDIAEAAIAARGEARLAGDYPMNAQLTFRNVAWTRVERLFGRNTGQPNQFEARVEGELSVNGPITKPEQLHASLQVPKFQLTTIPGSAKSKPVVVENQGPLVATLDGGVVRLQSARLTGPDTEVAMSGSASLVQQQALDLKVKANTNLALIQNFGRDFFSSGSAAFAATVRGPLRKPAVSGQLDLKAASFNTTEFPNGVSNANGTIVFNGNAATIRSLTAESGGGKLTFTGSVSLEDKVRLALHARAEHVRIRPQPGISIVASANLRLTGTSDTSRAAGSITVNAVTYAPQSDLGSLLTRSAPPVQAPTAPSAFLENMKLDLRVRSSSATTVQASLAENLQFDTDLRIRGTAAEPGVLGRINITEGDLVFFGSQYRVSSGTISFYNPVRIDPVLNITLETQAKSVDVVLTVSGPVDNMKLSYTSDPPLQFQEIVALLAAGKTPTSDPTVLANQPSAPQQSFEQMGESAIISKALADPVASRLQRVFGVSQLKIDPSFTNGSDVPQARVTLQQQVASNLTFTYVTALDDPNTQIVRVEWSLNPRWSAAATRDENGIVSLSFLYKRQFR